MLVSTEVSKTENKCLIGQSSPENNADPTSFADESMGL